MGTGWKALDGGSLAPKSFQHKLALGCLLTRRRQRVGGHKMRVYPEDLGVATSTEARKLSDMKRAIVATTVQSVFPAETRKALHRALGTLSKRPVMATGL